MWQNKIVLSLASRDIVAWHSKLLISVGQHWQFSWPGSCRKRLIYYWLLSFLRSLCQTATIIERSKLSNQTKLVKHAKARNEKVENARVEPREVPNANSSVFPEANFWEFYRKQYCFRGNFRRARVKYYTSITSSIVVYHYINGQIERCSLLTLYIPEKRNLRQPELLSYRRSSNRGMKRESNLASKGRMLYVYFLPLLLSISLYCPWLLCLILSHINLRAFVLNINLQRKTKINSFVRSTMSKPSRSTIGF